MKWLRSAIMVTFVVTPVVSNAGFFEKIPNDTQQRTDAKLVAKARSASHLAVDMEGLRAELLANDNLDVELPLPDGSKAIYHLEAYNIAEQAFMDAHPDIKAFRGVDIDNPANNGTFSITSSNFRGMLKYNGETIFIDPQYHEANTSYISYYTKNAERIDARPTDEVLHPQLSESVDDARASVAKAGGSDGVLRTYRIAIATTGEYTAYFGGVAGARNEIVAALTRVNEVYEDDLGISFTLVANNDLVIETDSVSDPYENDSFTDIYDIHGVMSERIGDDNYDIGHLFGTGPGGIAGVGSACQNDRKALGLTGLMNPTGDVFYIDYLSHEIGHQFGANHTFDSFFRGCSGFRNSKTAYEPGSGSTIMGYAGLCAIHDLQDNSDPYFHAGSIAEIKRFITTGVYEAGPDAHTNNNIVGCANETNPVNSLPNAIAPNNFTIPALTPFVLSGTVADLDGLDTLTYVWEQMDTSRYSSEDLLDNGSNSFFRSFEPVSPGAGGEAVRYLPSLQHILATSSDEFILGESYPRSTRNMKFRLTVRDHSLGGGATAYDDVTVTVTTDAGPFRVTFPTNLDLWSTGEEHSVEWDVANTDVSPVNCLRVDITLSSDGGQNFNSDLILNTPNDGSQNIIVPVDVSGPIKVKVACSDGRFFSISGTSVNTTLTNINTLEDSSSSGGSSGGGSTGHFLWMVLGLLIYGKLRKNSV